MSPGDQLPIDEVLGDIVEAVRTHRRVVVEAPPGAGKSTRVPPALLDAALSPKQVVLLEPRRVAARAVASRIAAERGGAVGDEVGWQIRWERRGGARTRLWVVTEGILTRRALSDPFLDEIGILVLDEFHERSVHTDLALGIARELLSMRDDLHLVVMSATLDAGRVADYLDCPAIASQGRTYPVRTAHLPGDPADLAGSVQAAVTRLIDAPDDDGGDILVFLPGMREIDQCRRLCSAAFGERFALHRLHSQLPEEEQDAALRASTRRKVILATNIAETSLTIPGVTAVIDSGLVRVSRADPNTGFDRLETVATSLASASQRAGRAGRTAPGRAIRLWSAASETRRPRYDEPEIARIDLCGPVLDVMRWSGASADAFPWFEPPPPARVAAAVATLRSLGALQDSAVTPLGARLSDLPLHPRLGRLLAEADARGLGSLGADLAACISQPDWVTSVTDSAPPVRSDALLRARLLRPVAAGQTAAAERSGLSVSVGAARSALRVARDLERYLEKSDITSAAPDDDAGRALLAAFGDRIAFQAQERRYALCSGGSLFLDRASLLRPPPVLVATSVFGTRRVNGVECVVAQQATEVEEQWLPSDRLVEEVVVRFDAELERLVARRVWRFDQLLVREQSASLADATGDPVRLAEALVAAVSDDLERAYRLEKDELRYLQRIEFLRQWMPELELPDPRASSTLLQMVGLATTFAELRKQGYATSYGRLLTGRQRQAVEAQAPDRFTLGARSFRIDYADADQPVLAARIQDFFGQRKTPSIAGGRVQLTLHLLAPNQRPQQVTRDLASFWANTYAEVRKELRARYPKHAWPEDPTAPE